MAALTNARPVGSEWGHHPPAKARQQASEGVIEVVELKFSPWYNTGREVMTLAQTKAHMEATTRYNKKAYDRKELKLRKDAEINGDVLRTHAEAMGESVNAFLLRAVLETMQRDNAKTADKEE